MGVIYQYTKAHSGSDVMTLRQCTDMNLNLIQSQIKKYKSQFGHFTIKSLKINQFYLSDFQQKSCKKEKVGEQC